MSLLGNISLLKTKRKIPKQILSDLWEERNSILQSDVNLFCWKRPIELAISHYLEQLLERELEPIRCTVDSNDLQRSLSQARSAWDKKHSMASELFWQDVFQLTYDFLSFSKTKTGTLHLKVINDNACTKFHTDGYNLRLFTTYHGKGTEWLPEKAVNRSALGKSNALIVKDTTQIQQMGTFHVGILKGETPNTSSPVKGIVHRSPEIAQSREHRIILRIDL